MDLMKEAKAIGDIGLAVRAELERIGEHHSCILASAVLTEALRRSGYPTAIPMTVRAQIFNPPFQQWIRAHGFPEDPAEQERCVAAGGRLIGLGTGPEGSLPAGRWAGHAAVIIPGAFGDRHALSDVTITQANKPAWGVDLPPLLVRVSDEFIRGEREFKADPNGCIVVYKAFPDDLSYQGSSQWTDSERWKRIADRVKK